MTIRDFIDKIMDRGKRFGEMQEQDRFAEKIEERKLSSEERELNRFVEEDRQKQIKKHLKEFREAKRNEIWHTAPVISKGNMFAGQDSLLKQPNIFDVKHSKIMKGGNIFIK